jgi:glycosyltransferase involved in cell wall biosynthesis
MSTKKTLVISAINFFEGGPLSVLTDCLLFLNNNMNNYRIIALVHSINLFDKKKYSKIEFIEFAKSRQSYFFRLYYEYIYFRKFSQIQKVTFWLSLHDITPNLKNVKQAVYCHNPSPFNTVNLKDIFIQPTQFFFRLFYKYLYSINIKKNEKIIVQQRWIKDEFKKMFSLDESKIIVAPLQVPEIPPKYFRQNQKNNNKEKIFFFPTFPRPFKNIELIGEATKLLNNDGIYNFKVIITIDGSENNYARSIINQYKRLKNIIFIGLLSREEVYEYYARTDCLIFPSKLETWGIPITEFKYFEKTILAANLPYARETIGSYDKSILFDPYSPKSLAKEMKKILSNENLIFFKAKESLNNGLIAHDWDELFSILLK